MQISNLYFSSNVNIYINSKLSGAYKKNIYMYNILYTVDRGYVRKLIKMVSALTKILVKQLKNVGAVNYTYIYYMR